MLKMVLLYMMSYMTVIDSIYRIWFLNKIKFL